MPLKQSVGKRCVREWEVLARNTMGKSLLLHELKGRLQLCIRRDQKHAEVARTLANNKVLLVR